MLHKSIFYFHLKAIAAGSPIKEGNLNFLSQVSQIKETQVDKFEEQSSVSKTYHRWASHIYIGSKLGTS